MKPVRMLTEYEKKFIEDNFKTMPYQDIGDHLGFKKTWIENYCNRTKLRKNKKAEIVEMEENGFFNVNQRWSWI